MNRTVTTTIGAATEFLYTGPNPKIDQVDAARSGFETGRNSFLTLIDAERNLRNVELGYEEALANLGRRRAELDRALGRIPGLTW